MNKLSRKRFVASTTMASLGGFTFLRRPADAAEFNLKFANNWVLTHPLNIRGREAIAKIKQESKGRVDIQIFPNNQLGGDTDMLSQVRSGAITFFTLSGLTLATVVPETSIYGIAFAFKGYKEAWAALDGDLGDYMRRAVNKAGLYCMQKNWDNGFRQFTTSTKPINTPEDLRGLKIRVPVSPLWTSTFKAFGASPTAVNFNEVYVALQTKLVDGAENSLIAIESARLYEVQKYVAMTNYMWDNYFFLANASAWSALPKDIQEIIERNFNTAGLAEREDIARLNGSLVGELKGKGMIFNTPVPEPFRAVLQKAGYYNDWRQKYGPETWALLEKYAGKLA